MAAGSQPFWKVFRVETHETCLWNLLGFILSCPQNEVATLALEWLPRKLISFPRHSPSLSWPFPTMISFCSRFDSFGRAKHSDFSQNWSHIGVNDPLWPRLLMADLMGVFLAGRRIFFFDKLQLSWKLGGQSNNRFLRLWCHRFNRKVGLFSWRIQFFACTRFQER